MILTSPEPIPNRNPEQKPDVFKYSDTRYYADDFTIAPFTTKDVIDSLPLKRPRNDQPHQQPCVSSPEDVLLQCLNIFYSEANCPSCDIAVWRQAMCGMCFASMAEYRSHLSAVHPGASRSIFATSFQSHYTKVSGIPTGDDDALPEHCSNGTRALREWVLLGGWRKASYESQPYRRPVHSLIGRYCDFLEEFA